MDKKTNKLALILILVMQALFSVNFGIIYFSLFVILQGNFQLSTYTSYDVVVVFMLMNGSIHFIASPIGDKQLDYKKMMLFCIIMLACSSALMSSKYTFYFQIGLALFTISYGLIVTCINVIIKNHLAKNKSTDSKVFAGFSFNALSANIGILTGTIIAGITNDLSIIFSIGFACTIASLIILIIFYDIIDAGDVISVKNPKYIIFLFTYTFLFFLTYLCFDYPIIAYAAILIITIYIISIILKAYLRSDSGTQKSNMKLFIYFSFFGVIFWVLYSLIPLLMMNVIGESSYFSILGYDIDFKAQWVGTLNTIVVIVFLFVTSISFNRIRVNYFKTFLSGYYLAFVAFSLLFISSVNTIGTDYININYVLLYIFFFSLAEVLLQPIGYAFVNRLVVDDYKNYMIGAVSFSTTGFAPVISGYLSKLMTPNDTLNQFSQISYFKIDFGSLVIVTAICIIFLLLFSSKKAFKV